MVLIYKKYFPVDLSSSELSAHHVAHVLEQEWRNSHSVAKVQELIDFVVTEYGFELDLCDASYDDGDGWSLLDYLCSGDRLDFEPAVVAAVVSSGAAPVLHRGRRDVVEQVIRKYAKGERHKSPDWRQAAEYIDVLLHGGAHVNRVTYCDDGWRLFSESLHYFFHVSKKKSLDVLCCNNEYLRLLLPLIQHGAYVDCEAAAECLWKSTDDFFDWEDSPDLSDLQIELAKNLRNAGLAVSTFDNCLSKALRSSLSAKQRPLAMQQLFHAVEPPPERLQFLCRLVIRRQLMIAQEGRSILAAIDELPLPPVISSYIQLQS